MDGVVAGEPPGGNTGSLVVDLDGVLYVGPERVPGAADALVELRDAGWHLLFVTNNSTKERAAAAAAIAERTGFPAEHDQVLTSAFAAARHLAGTVSAVLVVGAPGLSTTLEAEGIRVVEDDIDVDAVVVGLDPGLTYHRLTEATLAVRNGARLVATNNDSTYPAPRGLYPGGGAIVAALERATDVVAEVCGKPYEPMRKLVRERVGTGPVVVVGDRPETDLALAGAEGWRKVLVMTGVTHDAATVPPEHAPDVVLPSIADLPGVISSLVG
jgi:4-nitrophenyl phosphatase